MKQMCQLSDVTITYLDTFHCILEHMIQEMTSAELTESISYNFIVQMIPHHEAAIQMSQNILLYTNNIPLQNIATQIIQEQTQSIENMKKVQSCCALLKNTRQDVRQYQMKIDQIMQTMFSNMKCARYNNRLNCNFMWEMIPHHQGAVEMSYTTLSFHICSELKPILEAILTSQERGICQMQHLLHCIGCC